MEVSHDKCIGYICAFHSKQAGGVSGDSAPPGESRAKCCYLETMIDVLDTTLGDGRARQRQRPTSTELTHRQTHRR